MKRRFVRFISQEIRTPLYTVCFGLELLQRELRKETSKAGGERDQTGFAPTVEDIDFWHNVAMDVKENAAIAVSILNDMLNYDKLETKTLELETEEVNPWALIDQTVHQFQLQAVNRDVELEMIFAEPKNTNKVRKSMMASLCSTQPSGNVPATDMEINNLCVIVDEVQLDQVFRNSDWIWH
ncbi:sensor histidine kinase [Nitzschia inconspicua]|uniref:Sensor histidine kinase n=1 Tax=Nitzschia inconspicua TaxID=303405 RepID=A0A9K3LX12_9STRA|nr:sensor histidine kinase [Nitzschia inconspicua]